ncbi:unnamed protein product, partial [Ectocarpus sp. 4 AP-2014]
PRAPQGAAALAHQGPGYLDAPVSRRPIFSDSVSLVSGLVGNWSEGQRERLLAELLRDRYDPLSPVVSDPDLPATLRLVQSLSESDDAADPHLADSLALARDLQEADDALEAHSKAVLRRVRRDESSGTFRRSPKRVANRKPSRAPAPALTTNRYFPSSGDTPSQESDAGGSGVAALTSDVAA